MIRQKNVSRFQRAFARVKSSLSSGANKNLSGPQRKKEISTFFQQLPKLFPLKGLSKNSLHESVSSPCVRC